MNETRRISRPSLLIAVALGLVILIVVMGSWRGMRWWEWAHYDRPVWSPDGSRILIHFGGRAAESNQLIIVNPVSRIWAPRTRTIDVPATLLELPAWRSQTEVSLFSNEISSGHGPPYYYVDEPTTLLLYNLLTDDWQRFQAPLPIPTGIDWHPDGTYALVSLQDSPRFPPENVPSGVYRFVPERQKFELWHEAEEPYTVSFSPDGRFVAFFNYIQPGDDSERRLADVRLVIADVETKRNLVTHVLASETPSRRWSVDGGAGLSWSPDGEWLLGIGNMVTYRSEWDYDVESGFFIVPATPEGEVTFWLMDFNPVDFDMSPSGNEIVVTTVTAPFIGKNTIRILNVPQQFQ